MRGDKDLGSYLEARQTEANSFQKKRHLKSRREQTVNEVVPAIPATHDRLLIMTVIEQGREALQPLQLARAAIPKLWPIELDAVISGGATPEAPFGSTSELTEQDRLALRKLASGLTNNAELREFNLIYDNARTKMRGAIGATLISKNELAMLRSLAQIDP